MARTLKDAALESRAARSRLKPRGKPYYRAIEEGLHLGYRKSKGQRGETSAAGKWVLRHYIGEQAYVVKTLGPADDFSDADGEAILDFKQAQAKARAQMVKRANAAAGKTGPLTVADAMDNYLEFLRTKRKSAYAAESHDRAHIRPALGDIEVESLTEEVISRWHSAMVKRAPMVRAWADEPPKHRKAVDTADGIRARQATANRTLTTLKAALNRLWRASKVPSDAAWRRVEPFEGVDAARVRYLSVEEAKRIINAAEREFRKLVQAALQTGARYGELVALEVRDFNPDVGTLAIRQSKSAKPRQVVLTDEGALFFKQICTGRGGDEIMFTKPDGARWNKTDQARPMKAACEAAQIKPPIGIHGMRHTWASHAVMNGVPLLVVAKNLGHSDTRMVEKHYGHLAEDYITAAIRKGAPKFGFKPDKKVVELTTRNA